MRIPHTVPANALKAYQPSLETLGLVAERGRRLRAENWTWDDEFLPTLVEECVKFFVSDFDEHKRVLPFLGEYDTILLLETLLTDLSLDIVIPLIPDGEYWKRRCMDTWPNMNDVTTYGDSWKRMFTERYIEDLVESEEPGYTDWTEVGNCLKLCSPYVKRLVISQLQPPRVMESIPNPPDLCSTDEFIPQHLDLSPILTILENLEELHLQLGVKNIGMKLTFKCFRVHDNDVKLLGKGLQNSKNLKVLKITSSDIDDAKLKVILHSLEGCDSFNELEIAHCKITDAGAKDVGTFITIKPSLKHIRLTNNFIKEDGIEGIAYAITKCKDTLLETLDLKFNLIGDSGGQFIAAALANSSYPTKVVLTGCGLGEKAGMDLVNMLKVNKTLTTLDLTNNALGTEVGYMMARAIEHNYMIKRIDVRNCGFDEDCELIIHTLTLRNREMERKKELIKAKRTQILVDGKAVSYL